jgi:hypothetical protein
VKIKLNYDIIIGPLDTANEFDDRLGDVLCGGLLHVGLDASTILRALHFKLDVDTFEIERPRGPMNNGPLCFQNEAERDAFFDPLYRIKRKSSFWLAVEFSQMMIDLDRWEEAFAVFKPILPRFVREGEPVRII